MLYDKILLVDDELPILKSLIRTLRMEFAEIYSTTNVEEAIEIVKQHRISLVISDFRMPKMNGVELLIKLKTINPQLSTIMLSGQAELSDVSKALNVGALHKFITKPWDSVELIKEIHNALQRQADFAHHDVLTQCLLPNRLNDQLQKIINNKNDVSTLLLTVDLCNTATLNTTYGVTAVNTVIEGFAQQLKQQVSLDIYRSEDKFFMVLDCAAESVNLLTDMINKIDKAWQAFIPSDSPYGYKLSVSELKSWEKIDSDAINDRKCYLETIGHSPYFWLGYEDEPKAELKYLVKLLLDSGPQQFVAFFQPQVNVETNTIDGCEALVRRQTEFGNYEPPMTFIPILTKYNFIDDMTLSIFEQTLSMLEELEKAGYPDIRCAINVVANQVEKGIICQFLETIAQSNPRHLLRLDLEMTDTQLIQSYDKTRSEMQKLSEFGVRLSIDDFGTGFSGFEMICELPFDVLKVDGRFIQALGQSVADNAIFNSIVESAKSLNMGVIAECVEDLTQLDILRQHGCQHVQGYLFSPPLPKQEFVDYVQGYKQRERES
ncbi:GGDEF domain-containing phosphodiesterase [Vibrio palustris]|uniref:Phytochrome-like protein cph2 n=1 Tax=Vibrio palustris TaxID=1918946 RepID=A0A1R4B4Z3_9VIBR|nr:EAL domain-containing protein [Vibrio palustris]SJL83985.1 Phytochrome-like protein cph2 [Vibrio palustris]